MNDKDQNQNDKNPFSPKTEQPKSNKNIVFLLLVILLVVLFFYFVKQGSGGKNEMPYSDFLTLVDSKNIEWKHIKIVERRIDGRFSINKSIVSSKMDQDDFHNKYRRFLVQNPKSQEEFFRFTTYSPSKIDHELIKALHKQNIRFESEQPSNNFFMTFFIQFIPLILIFLLIWFFMFRQIQGSGNKALSFGKSRARLARNDHRKVTFDDVAGVEEAKEELKEAVEFLREPAKFKKLGAKIPKGVLLVGPPGTGKTLLARSVAGEANRPFFTMSGSEFVEMFVGVGASRVRDLFDQGKKNAPCIIFIDELDAVGRVRGAGYGGGHDEREQTLNQMLVEMDGFDTDETVIIMAATNRPDVLDPALLRPGRFDRRVMVGSPDIKGREAILEIHMRKVPYAKSVDVNTLAKGTPGFSGADLANLVNEAALIAARRDKKKIQMEDFEYAKDKVLMGPERKSMILSENEKINTAYHEAGHALLAFMLPKVNPLHKVSIIPRGNALGITQTLPKEERYTVSKEYIMEEMMVLFGGRICEEYKFGAGGITNGASNDIERGTQLARSMVCEWGMSDELGPITYGQKEEPIFIGKEIARHKDYSEKTAEHIDQEVKVIVETCFNKAKDMIMENIEKLEKIAQELLEKEVLDRKEVEALIGKA
ncbi:MAG: ATP-dependent zinc metalloprotease FtsH [Spirochaetota bacterium]|nr:ATP-dependent zinc metalloprotease FtsH [Spirochaetota bacterium]